MNERGTIGNEWHPASWLLAAIALSLVLHLVGEARGAAWQVYLFKPLTTSLVIALALGRRAPTGSRYRPAIVAGLFCSLAGDTFLMLPSDRFIEGLVSFLAAHLCYLVAFVGEGGPGRHPRLAVPWTIWFVTLLAWLAPTLGPLLVPVAVYGLALGTMAWQAWERAARLPAAATRGAAWGAALFVLSDTALAINRFVAPFDGERMVVMGTYIAAQTLLALSVSQPAAAPTARPTTSKRR